MERSATVGGAVELPAKRVLFGRAQIVRAGTGECAAGVLETQCAVKVDELR